MGLRDGSHQGGVYTGKMCAWRVGVLGGQRAGAKDDRRERAEGSDGRD